MPELPDIEAYLAALDERIAGHVVQAVRLRSPFLVRTVEPPLNSIVGSPVTSLRRIGKRIVFGFPEPRFAVVHLMKAGRFRWGKPGAGLPGKMGLCAFDFEHGSLILTEAGSKRRASIHVVDGENALEQLDPGGLEVLDASLDMFKDRLLSARRTLKRQLTDPNVFSGIGSAYADEILLRARLSPLKRTDQLSEEHVARLYEAIRAELGAWRDRLVAEARSKWPKATAFRPEMGAHGKAGEPCPQCGSPIQKIVYRETETNYCAQCQTDGVVLKDRSLSRLLKDEWPRSLDEWEDKIGRG